MQCLPKRKSRTPKSWNENQRSTMELDPSTRRACHWPLEWYVFSKCLICCSLVNPLFNYEDIKLLVEINMQSMLHATWENVFFWIINAELQFSQNKVVHNIRMWLDNIEAWYPGNHQKICVRLKISSIINVQSPVSLAFTMECSSNGLDSVKLDR